MRSGLESTLSLCSEEGLVHTQSVWPLPMAKTGGEGKVPVESLSRAGKRKVRRGQRRDSGGR